MFRRMCVVCPAAGRLSTNPKILSTPTTSTTVDHHHHAPIITVGDCSPPTTTTTATATTAYQSSSISSSFMPFTKRMMSSSGGGGGGDDGGDELDVHLPPSVSKADIISLIILVLQKGPKEGMPLPAVARELPDEVLEAMEEGLKAFVQAEHTTFRLARTVKSNLIHLQLRNAGSLGTAPPAPSAPPGAHFSATTSACHLRIMEEDQAKQLQEELSNLSVSNQHLLRDVLYTEPPWVTRTECPKLIACVGKLNAMEDYDGAKKLGFAAIDKRVPPDENPIQAARRELLIAKERLNPAKEVLSMKEKLLAHYDKKLIDLLGQNAAEDVVDVAEKKSDVANRDVREANATVKEREKDVETAKAGEATEMAKHDAILESFRLLSEETKSLTRILPFGMLGRDQCLHDIKKNVYNPNDKYPPIMIIATSRSGKTLMLDTLRTTLNTDPKSGIFVVTCSLNNHRATADKFEGKCKASDAPQFVTFVLNLLLFGSVGHHDKPPNANAESLAWISPDELCQLVREKHQLPPSTKLLFAIDELTTVFDRFDQDGQAYIASRLGYLSDNNSQLLMTGFTVKAEKSFLGVSKRKPILVELVAVGEENRFRYIPLMTAMIWGIQGQLDSSTTDSHTLTHFYCVAHELLKSSPGLMGTIVERLVFNTDAHLEIRPVMSMWDVVNTLRDLLPDKHHFQDRQRCTSGLNLLNEYLTTPEPTLRDSAFEGLMELNLAAPGRLDAFRVVMALVECRSRSAKQSNELHHQSPLPPAASILLAFMERCNTLYGEWNVLNKNSVSEGITSSKKKPKGFPQKKVDDFGSIKGEFFEVACQYGLMLLWKQMQGGIGTENTPLAEWKDQLQLSDLEVKPFFVKFPLSKHLNPVDLDDGTKLLFTPNTLFYPEKPEINPLVDLVLNIPTKDGGLLQVWVQAKHTLHKITLSIATFNNAMSIVDKYNKRARGPPVRHVLYLIVGPRRLSVSIEGGKEKVEATPDTPWTLPDRASTPLTLHCMTSPKAREALLGGFISQLVPDFDSHDSALEVSLPKKVLQLSALNRTPIQNESSEQKQNRLDVTAHEDKFIQYMKEHQHRENERFKVCLERVDQEP